MVSFLVGIAGGTASGKSTLARRLVAYAGSHNAAVMELDWYYRCQAQIGVEERARANYDHPDALEFPLLVEHLTMLRAGKPIVCPSYDFTLHTRDPLRTNVIEPYPVILVEGILLLVKPEVRTLFDRTLFTVASDEERLQRRLERDVKERGRTRESIRAQWQETVHPMHKQFCEPSRAFADTIIENCGGSDAAVEQLWSELWSEATRLRGT